MQETQFDAQVGTNYRITIPKKIARKLGIDHGTWIRVKVQVLD